jgi:hypothetical protein
MVVIAHLFPWRSREFMKATITEVERMAAETPIAKYTLDRKD